MPLSTVNWIVGQVNGRVVVDATSYFDNNSDQRRSLDDLSQKSIAPRIETKEQTHINYGGGGWCGTGRLRESQHQEAIRHRKIENGELPTEERAEPGKWLV